MDELRDQLDQAFTELFDRMDRLDAGSAAARIQAGTALAMAKDADAAQQEAPALDLAPLDERLAALDARLHQFAEGLGAHLAADRARIEASLTGLSKEINALAARPVEADTKPFLEAADRAALHTAADIANLRNDVEALTEAVRLQDKNLGELRTTLDWIKERLLLR